MPVKYKPMLDFTCLLAISLHRRFFFFFLRSSMEGLVLVARAYASSKQSQGVLQVLSRAEEICASEAVEIKGEGRGRQQGGGGQAAARLHPPAELYEVAARTLALAGLWEGAASAVRRLEVSIWRLFLIPVQEACFCFLVSQTAPAIARARRKASLLGTVRDVYIAGHCAVPYALCCADGWCSRFRLGIIRVLVIVCNFRISV